MRQVGRATGRKGAAGKTARRDAGGRRMLPLRAAFWRRGGTPEPSSRPRRRGRQTRLERIWTEFAEGPLVRWQSSVAVGSFLTISLFYAIVAGGHLGAIGRGVGATVDGGLAALGLSIDKISVSGREHARMDEILAALGAMRGNSILSFDTDRARARIEQIGWVSSAEVQRLFPNKVLVEIHERQPYAVWQHGGEFSVIDDTGTRLNGLVATDFRHLPQVVGSGAANGAQELIGTVEQYPAVSEKVTAMVRIADRRWNLRMVGGIDVLLPEGEFTGAVKELAELQAEHQILSRDIRRIDFRLADRVTIQLSDEAAERRRASAKAAAKARRKSG